MFNRDFNNNYGGRSLKAPLGFQATIFLCLARRGTNLLEFFWVRPAAKSRSWHPVPPKNTPQVTLGDPFWTHVKKGAHSHVRTCECAPFLTWVQKGSPSVTCGVFFGGTGCQERLLAAGRTQKNSSKLVPRLARQRKIVA